MGIPALWRGKSLRPLALGRCDPIRVFFIKGRSSLLFRGNESFGRLSMGRLSTAKAHSRFSCHTALSAKLLITVPQGIGTGLQFIAAVYQN